MKLAHLFYCDNLFNYFQKYKIYFFITPLFILLFIVVFIDLKDDDLEKINYLEKQKNKLSTLEIKRKPTETIKVIQEIENYIKINNIKLKSIKLSKNTIFLEIYGLFNSSVKIIDFIESYNGYLSIKNLTINSYEKSNLINISLEITLLREFVNYYPTNNSDEVKNIFANKKIVEIKEEKSETSEFDYRVYAIIGKEALINDKWLKNGEYINNHKIEFIGKDFVSLKGKDKSYKLRIFKNESIR